MTNTTTAPVQSLVDEVLAELDRAEKTHLDGEVRDIARDAVRLIREQRAELARRADPVAVPDENGLLPCPFCGGNAELHQRETESLWSHNQVTWSQVGCHECECVGADCCEDDDGSEAVAHWNTRAADHAAPTPPAQQPSNRHGVDANYFHKKLGLVLRDFDSLTPDELARSLARLAKVADESVLLEAEFAGPPAQRSQAVLELSDADRVPDDFRNQASGYRAGWNDCRAAMLAAPGDTAAPEQAEQPKCNVCRDVGIVGHSDICPACSDSWQPPAERAEQPTGTTSDQYRAELYDEVWRQARDMGYANVTDALVELERAKAQTEQPVRWGSAGTVGNLIAQLRTIDPGMPVYASLRIKNGVRDGVMLKGLVISYEHGDGRFIVNGGPERCVVIWTQPDDRQADRVEDLAALARKLVRALRKAAPEHDLPQKALDYLQRSGLAGSPLRTEQAEQQCQVNRSVIRGVFLRNGFTIKEGHSDLKPYVYAAAEELLALDGKAVAAEQDAVKVPRDLLERVLKKWATHGAFTDVPGWQGPFDELRAMLGGDA